MHDVRLHKAIFNNEVAHGWWQLHPTNQKTFPERSRRERFQKVKSFEEITLVGASSAAIVYSQSTGDIFYNPNLAVAGLAAGGKFADLNVGLSLTINDFVVVA
jgi:hypothetical protein